MALTDLLTPRIVEIGKLKIGGLGEERQSRSGGTYRMPVKYDHFVITTLHRDAARSLIPDKALMDELAQTYADQDGKLRQLPIAVLSDDIEEVMQAQWGWYAGKKCWAKSDGKTITWLGDPKKMHRLAAPKVEDWQPEFAALRDPKGNLLFKLHVTFSCVIASKESRWGGVYKLRTTSRISGEQLYGSLTEVSRLCRGIIAGRPLRLVLRPIQVTPDDKPTTVYVVHVELIAKDLLAIQQESVKLAELQVLQAKRLEHLKLEYKHLGTEETPDEEAEIQEEFHPESDAEPQAPVADDPLMCDSPAPLPSDPLIAQDNGEPSYDEQTPDAPDYQDVETSRQWLETFASRLRDAQNARTLKAIGKEAGEKREYMTPRDWEELSFAFNDASTRIGIFLEVAKDGAD